MNDRLDDALVLRLVVTGESDLVVTLFHPQRGRIDALAKSARKSLRRFGALEPLARVSVQFGRGRGRLPLLTEATLGRSWPGREYRQLTLASYAAELALHAAQPEHADPALHAWLQERLDSACSPQAEVVHWWLDTDIGFLQVVGGCPISTIATGAASDWIRRQRGPRRCRAGTACPVPAARLKVCLRVPVACGQRWCERCGSGVSRSCCRTSCAACARWSVGCLPR